MKLKTRINKLRIAKEKTSKLLDYIGKNRLDDLQGEGQIDIDSILYCDVYSPIDKELTKLSRILESIQANNLIK